MITSDEILIHRLFHEDFSPIYMAPRELAPGKFERNLHETVCRQMQIN